MNYNKRAAIRFQSFQAVQGHQEGLKELEKRTEQEACPILSEDQIEEINQELTFVMEHKAPCQIQYYKKGFRHICEGIILEISPTAITLAPKQKIVYEQLLFIQRI